MQSGVSHDELDNALAGVESGLTQQQIEAAFAAISESNGESTDMEAAVKVLWMWTTRSDLKALSDMTSERSSKTPCHKTSHVTNCRLR